MFRTHLSHRSLAVLGTALLCATAPSLAWAQVTVVHVEEDWELSLGEPDSNSTAPQVTCVLSPHRDTDAWHAVFELNHHTIPQFAPGGLQLQVWKAEDLVGHQSSPRNDSLAEVNEVVTWTQAMSLSDGQLTFQILNGDSTTWGDFGGEDGLTLQVDTDLTSLNEYDPEVSVSRSAIGFAGNRVRSLVLKRVRYVLSTGQVVEDPQSRTAHSLEANP